MNTREDMAWAGGLFEGEGSIGLNRGVRGGNFPNPQASLVTTDEDTVRRFAGIIGTGRIYGPYDYGNKPVWRWAAMGFPQTQAVIAMLWPWLGQRRKARARVVLIEGRGVGYAEAARRGHEKRHTSN